MEAWSYSANIKTGVTKSKATSSNAVIVKSPDKLPLQELFNNDCRFAQCNGNDWSVETGWIIFCTSLHYFDFISDHPKILLRLISFQSTKPCCVMCAPFLVPRMAVALEMFNNMSVMNALLFQISERQLWPRSTMAQGTFLYTGWGQRPISQASHSQISRAPGQGKACTHRTPNRYAAVHRNSHMRGLWQMNVPWCAVPNVGAARNLATHLSGRWMHNLTVVLRSHCFMKWAPTTYHVLQATPWTQASFVRVQLRHQCWIY